MTQSGLNRFFKSISNEDTTQPDVDLDVDLASSEPELLEAMNTED